MNCKNRVLAVIVAVVTALSLSSCKASTPAKIINNIIEKISSFTETFTENATSEPYEFLYSDEYTSIDPREYYSYSNLNDVQKSVYDALLDASQKMVVGRFKIPTCSQDDVTVAMLSMIDDYPQLIWQRGFCKTITIEGDSNLYAAFGDEDDENIYYYDADTRDGMLKSLYDAVESIVKSTLTSDMSDYDKALKLHDYLCTNTKYDEVAAETLDTEKYHNAWTAYGALVDKSAVCAGYSYAYNILLKYAGINSTVIRGNVSDEAHMWNAVQIDGAWYQVDVTFDDTGADELLSSHEFFMIETDLMNKTHTPYKNYLDQSEIEKKDNKFNTFVPECNDSSKNYYTKYGLYIDNQDEFVDKFTSILNSNTGDSGKICVEIRLWKDVDDEQVSAALSKFKESLRWPRRTGRKYISINYRMSYNDVYIFIVKYA